MIRARGAKKWCSTLTHLEGCVTTPHCGMKAYPANPWRYLIRVRLTVGLSASGAECLDTSRALAEYKWHRSAIHRDTRTMADATTIEIFDHLTSRKEAGMAVCQSATNIARATITDRLGSTIDAHAMRKGRSTKVVRVTNNAAVGHVSIATAAESAATISNGQRPHRVIAASLSTTGRIPQTRTGGGTKTKRALRRPCKRDVEADCRRIIIN